jgi:hypothetical protein
VTFAHDRRHNMRGAVMAETAMVISFTLVMLFSILQLIILGYLQMAGDAATFIAAHEYTLGVPQAAVKTALGAIVPSPIASSVTFIPSPPPTIDPSLFTNVYGNFDPGNRSGGYTLVRPQNFQVGLKNSTYKGFLGFDNVGLSAGAVEGYYLMTNNQMNNAGVGPNDDQGDGSVLTPANSSPFLPQSDAVIANMNTPPYYLPSPTMMICTTPWTIRGPSTSEGCSSAVEPWFLGLAEYLSNYNYGDSSVGTGIGGTFQAMAIHQRIYQKLIAAFPVIPAPQDTNLQSIAAQFDNLANQNNQVRWQTGSCTAGLTGAAIAANCGSNWTSPTMLPNGGVGLVYYDPLRYWIYQSAYTPPTLWNPTTMWPALYEPNPGALPGNDGPAGPAAWGGASPALVYYWDQPNYAPHPTAPGGYPTHPLNGGGAAGDPGY